MRFCLVFLYDVHAECLIIEKRDCMEGTSLSSINASDSESYLRKSTTTND